MQVEFSSYPESNSQNNVNVINKNQNPEDYLLNNMGPIDN